MDNTLVDEFGSKERPGIRALLDRLTRDGHTLLLWTNSTRMRALDILKYNELRKYFATCIFREDYDPANSGIMKDIRRVKGDILIDDDPAEIAYVRSIGCAGFLIPSYRKGKPVNAQDVEELSRWLEERRRKRGVRRRKGGWR